MSCLSKEDPAAAFNADLSCISTDMSLAEQLSGIVAHDEDDEDRDGDGDEEAEHAISALSLGTKVEEVGEQEEEEEEQEAPCPTDMAGMMVGTRRAQPDSCDCCF